MNCETCTEYLADFLLDELPESQAVLVQEHLNLCSGCMSAYKELKGTGKALEAVPALQPVVASDQFVKTLRQRAALESHKLIESLPPDRRLRLEARRAERQSFHSHGKAQPRSFWREPVFIIAVLGLTALTAALLLARKPSQAHTPLGVLSLLVGKAERTSQHEPQPYTAAKEGLEVWSGDTYFTAEDGSARFELADVSALTVCVGPSSEVAFRMAAKERNLAIVLEKGEIGIERSALVTQAGKPMLVELQIPGSGLVVSPDTCLYLALPIKDTRAGSLAVLAGSVEVRETGSGKTATVTEGQKFFLPPGDNPAGRAQMPPWRAALALESELANCFGGSVKIKSRQQNGVEIELLYRQEQLRGEKKDWLGEGVNAALLPRSETGIALPRARLRHVAAFRAPLSMELTLSASSTPDTSFAFGALKSADFGVAVDVAGEATLQIREDNRTTHSATITVRKQPQPDRAERLRLEILPESQGLAAVLSSSSGKSDSLPLPQKKTDAYGEVWLQGLGEGIVFDELKLSGVLSLDWLCERLNK